MQAKPPSKNGIILAVLVGVVVLLWLKWQWLLSRIWPAGPETPTLANRGQFGDSYGGLNTLFTGLAFAGVAFTIFLQLKEIRTREAERREQERDRLNEKFESRFFKLTDTLRANLQSFAFAERNGKAALAAFLEMQAPPRFGPESSIKKCLERYEYQYGQYQNQLGPYFRFLYRILKYTDQSSVDDKESYTGIVRAELGNAELWLLALNCLTERGSKFKPLLIKYHLLKHFSARGEYWDEVEQNIRNSYPASAFND